MFKPHMHKLGVMCCISFLLGFIFFIFGFSFENRSWEKILRQSLPIKGGSSQPFEIKQQGLYLITISQRFHITNNWAEVSADLIDLNRDRAFVNLSRGLWKQSGRDSDGTWTEQVTDFTYRIVLEPGRYGLEVESEVSNQEAVSAIAVNVDRLAGGGRWFNIFGVLLAGAGFIVFFFCLKADNQQA